MSDSVELPLEPLDQRGKLRAQLSGEFIYRGEPIVAGAYCSLGTGAVSIVA